MKLRELKALLALLRANGVSRYKAGALELEMGGKAAAPAEAPPKPAERSKPPPLQVPQELADMGVTADQFRDGANLFGGD